jgi:microcystin-dependent protein
MNAASGAAPTLAVDGLTAKAIRTHTSTALLTGALNSGGIYSFTYDSGDDCWYVHDFYTVSVTEFADNAFRVQDNGDATKELAFELSGLTTGNTRTLTVPDADGTILLDGDIGVTVQPIMTGAIVAWPTATPLSGWLECDGAAVSRTTYADLFAVISDDYGPGNGTTTFNLPDLRGEFIRGFDNGAGNDPDAASRTDRGDATTGDNVGTKQDFAVENATGRLGKVIGDSNTVDGVFAAVSAGTGFGTGGGTLEHVDMDLSTQLQTSTETRPRNVALMWIIKT